MCSRTRKVRIAREALVSLLLIGSHHNACKPAEKHPWAKSFTELAAAPTSTPFALEMLEWPICRGLKRAVTEPAELGLYRNCLLGLSMADGFDIAFTATADAALKRLCLEDRDWACAYVGDRIVARFTHDDDDLMYPYAHLTDWPDREPGTIIEWQPEAWRIFVELKLGEEALRLIRFADEAFDRAAAAKALAKDIQGALRKHTPRAA